MQRGEMIWLVSRFTVQTLKENKPNKNIIVNRHIVNIAVCEER